MKNKNFKLFIIFSFIVAIIQLLVVRSFLKQIYSSNLTKEVALNKGITIFLIFTFIFFILFIIYDISNKRKLKQIDLYINNILNNRDSFDIRSYNEDDLSKLKNDIYKITVLFKEEKEISLKEKKNLEIVLSDISHQLKTPLTSMYVINDLLLDNSLNDKIKKEVLNKNRNQLERIEWLVTSLLKISRLDSGVVKLKKEIINSKDLINKALEPLLILIELKNQQLVLDIEGFDYNIDINWFSEALINIIKNAIEHSNINGLIKISSTDNPIYQEIIIEDNGEGISAKDLPHIFERFYKVNAKSDSIGIGLNMAKKIIELSGGEIFVKSKLNEGTTFTIRIYKSII